MVNPDLPIHSVEELIAALKEKPGQLNFGHGGAGSAIHLAAELFQTMTGTKMNGVAYRGAPPALNDVMAGHVALMFGDVGAVIGQINAGKVRALGVTSTERVPALPDVPTIAEAGVPGFDAVGWTLILAPAGTPKPIIDRLSHRACRGRADAGRPGADRQARHHPGEKPDAGRTARNSWPRKSTAGAS